MRHAWIAGLLIACGGSPKAAESPQVQGPTCEGTAAHMVDVMAETMDPRPPEEDVRGMVQMISKRCEEDRWSFEAKRCLAAFKTASDADVCGTLLTDDQQAALIRDQNQKFGEPKPKSSGDAAAPPDGGGPKALEEGKLGKKDLQSTGAPPPPPPPGGTRGLTPKDPKNNADPCDGGE